MNWVTETINGVQVTFYRYDNGVEYLATRNEDGTFNVSTHDGEYKNVPFWGDFDNYRDMDCFADSFDWTKTEAYVCHVDHNEENAYVLMLPNRSVYIRI